MATAVILAIQSRQRTAASQKRRQIAITKEKERRKSQREVHRKKNVEIMKHSEDPKYTNKQRQLVIEYATQQTTHKPLNNDKDQQIPLTKHENFLKRKSGGLMATTAYKDKILSNKPLIAVPKNSIVFDEFDGIFDIKTDENIHTKMVHNNYNPPRIKTSPPLVRHSVSQSSPVSINQINLDKKEQPKVFRTQSSITPRGSVSNKHLKNKSIFVKSFKLH